jgi:hypothetical protein
MNKAQIEKAEAIGDLRKLLKPCDKVYTKLIHVSKSGMMRVMDCYVIRNNEPLRISWSAAKASGFTYNIKYEGVRVDGCGMDEGFNLVYSLSRALFPDGFKCTGKDCPSCDHSNDYRANPPKEGETNSAWRRRMYRTTRLHKDGGYALRQRWL